MSEITYAEFDGVPVCLVGGWCEREAGHEGPHVQAPIIPYSAWEQAVSERESVANDDR